MNRQRQPDDYQVLQGEIEKCHQEATELERQHTETKAALKVELGKGAQWFNESEVRGHQNTLKQIEQRQALVTDRIAALEDALPTEEQRRDAEREAKALLDTANTARQAFYRAWRRFIKGLEEVAATAVELMAARASVLAAVYPLADLVAKYGLDVTIPGVPDPPRDEATGSGLASERVCQGRDLSPFQRAK